jgi:hypothetical protein
MLERNQTECKKLEARLSRMITTGDKLHSLILPGSTVTYDVIEAIGLMLKVSIKDRVPPLIVSFGYAEDEEELV